MTLTGIRTPLAPARLAPSVALLALLGLFGTATGLRAQDECDDVSGAWAVVIQFPAEAQGPQDVTLTLEQSECAITGMVKGTRETPIEDGSVDGSSLRFLTSVTAGDGSPITITWEGTVEGDEISGTLDIGGMASAPFSGTRGER